MPEGILPEDGKLLLDSYPDGTWDGKTLQPYEAVMIYKK